MSSIERGLPRVGLLRRYPVTAILLFQYVPLVLIQAEIHNTPNRDYIYTVVTLGLLTAAATEWLLTLLRRPYSEIEHAATVPVIRVYVILGIGILATVLAAWLGQGSYAVQVGIATASPLVPFLTPLQPWLLLGSAYLIAAKMQGVIDRRQFIAALALAAVAQLAAALHQAITQPFLAYVVSVGCVALLAGTLRARTAAIMGVVLILAFPLIGTARNEMRSQLGASQFKNTQFSLESRLREDLYLSDSARLPQDHAYQQLAFSETLRYGVIPRALDPNRPQINTGSIISRSLGRSPLSSSALTSMGALWVFVGPYGLILFYAASATLMFVFTRRLTPHRLALATLLVANLLLIETTYPDSVASLLQACVAAIPAMLYLDWGRRRGEARRTPGSRIDREANKGHELESPGRHTTSQAR